MFAETVSSSQLPRIAAVTVDDADEFHAYVARRWDVYDPDDLLDGQLPMVRFRQREINRLQAYVVESAEDVGAALDHFLSGDSAERGSFARELEVQVLDGPWMPAAVERDLDESPQRLRFSDGSDLDVSFLGNSGSVRPIRDDTEPVDIGVALLEPITDREYGQIERVLQVLWDAAATESLTAAQEAQILAIARLIEDQHRDTTPGRTERWKLVGPLRAGLRYLSKELPKDALAWWKLTELLIEIDWSNVLPA